MHLASAVATTIEVIEPDLLGFDVQALAEQLLIQQVVPKTLSQVKA